MAQATGSIAGRKGRRLSSSSAAGQSAPRTRTSARRKPIGKTTRPAPASEPYDIGQDERLRKSPKFALDYLNICLDDPDPGLFLVALRDVARAYGGMKHLAQKADLNREALYHTLSKRGNPTLSSLESLLDVLGFKLKIERK
jgi:probable addiction module antidote protein